MSSSNRIRSGRHDDSIGRTRQRHHLFRLVLIGAGVAIPLGALVWAVAWSPLLKINRVDVLGIADPDALRAVTDAVIGRNILVFKTAALADAIMTADPALRDVRVTKQYLHGISVHATDRTPVGVWCRGDACQLWDRDGARWGEAVPSVGTLLTMVADRRSDTDVPPKLLTGILSSIDGLSSMSLKARVVTLPDAEPGGIVVSTAAGYDVYLDALGDVPDQLSTLSVFLGDRAKDAAFKPAYLDLRTPGRVYYK